MLSFILRIYVNIKNKIKSNQNLGMKLKMTPNFRQKILLPCFNKKQVMTILRTKFMHNFSIKILFFIFIIHQD